MEPTVSGNNATNSSNGTESSHFNEVYLVSAILALFAVIGTVGNVIVIYVLKRQKDNSSSTFFIMTLAFIDFFICLFIIPFVILMKNVNFELRYDFICKTGAFMYIASFLFSYFVMVAIAIDQYFCISQPIKRVMTVPRAKFLVVCMAVIASVLGVCVSLTVGVYAYAPGNGTYKVGETFGFTEGRKESTPGISQSEIVVSSSGSDVFNRVSDPTAASHAELRYTIIYTGYCDMNELIFPLGFQIALLYFHLALILFCLVAKIVLYILTYRSVLLQRKTRSQLQMKGHLSLALTTQTSITANCHSQIKIAAASSDNLKAAEIIVVNTVAFALSCVATILLLYLLMPYRFTGFYWLFVHSVANPIIYSFMNRNFREKVKNLRSGG